MAKAPKMVKLFNKYNARLDDAFTYNGLTGNIVYIRNSHSEVKISDGDTVVLAIHTELPYEPRTKAYIESYSVKLDSYMDALEQTASELNTANQKCISERNRQRQEGRVREENWF